MSDVDATLDRIFLARATERQQLAVAASTRFVHYTSAEAAANIPGGHFKFPHPWPGQNPPLEAAGRAG